MMNEKRNRDVVAKKVITLCDGTGCMNRGSRDVLRAIKSTLRERGLSYKDVKVNLSGCLGMCEKGPVMTVNPGYTLYGNVTEKDVPEIIDQHIVSGKPVT